MQGFGGGSLDTGGNVAILKIWENRDSGPYMHALHFTFGLGAFIAPLIARPFLFVDDSITESEIHSLLDNSTVDYSESLKDSSWTIKALYPLISGYSLLSAIFILFYFIKDYRKASENNSKKSSDDNEDKTATNSNLKFKVLLVGVMSLMFFIYVGMEVAFGTFISVFAVKSDLQFTRPQGKNRKSSSCKSIFCLKVQM